MRRSLTLVLALGSLRCGSAGKGPATPPVATVDVPQEQRRSTIRIEAKVDDEVKSAFARAIAASSLPDDLADAVESLSQGSGFFLKSGERLFAITNHHVVGSAQRVKLRLDEHTVIEDADVLYVDAHLDVAVIAVPDSVASALVHVVTLSKTPATSGEAVEASGWPGVGESLSYRLTNGAVSDASFVVPGQSKKDTFVQHTAVIDPGNSGGPLFRKKSLEVLGVNTFSLTGNHDLYVAVPSAVVQGVLERALAAEKMAHDPALRKQALVATCRDLVQEISNTGDSPKETIDIVADVLAGPRGVAGWEAHYVKRSTSTIDPDTGERVRGKPSVDEDALKALKDEAEDDDVIDYLRPYALDALYEDVRTAGAPLPGGCEQGLVQKDLDDLAERGAVRGRIDFTSGKSFRTLKWRLEQGHWRLIAFDAP